MEKNKSNLFTGQKKENNDTPQINLFKLFLEVGPVIVFFICNVYTEIFWATGIFMLTTAIALLISQIFLNRIPILPLVSGGSILLFGSLTLIFQEELFIKIKPTIINLIFASILFGGLIVRRSLIKYVLGEVYQLNDEGWRQLTLRWACFFIFLAIMNEFIWRTFSTEFWISFKLWGVMPITMAFTILQINLLKKHDTSLEIQKSSYNDSV
ncbi:MAG: putative intracellular septation protein A [Hyphomicrobiaceae bacterium hypho_1]